MHESCNSNTRFHFDFQFLQLFIVELETEERKKEEDKKSIDKQILKSKRAVRHSTTHTRGSFDCLVVVSVVAVVKLTIFVLGFDAMITLISSDRFA